MPHISVWNIEPSVDLGKPKRLRRGLESAIAIASELGGIDPDDIVVSLVLGPDGSGDARPGTAMRIYVESLYKKKHRDKVVLEQFAHRLHAAAREVYTEQRVSVTFRELIDPLHKDLPLPIASDRELPKAAAK